MLAKWHGNGDVVSVDVFDHAFVGLFLRQNALLGYVYSQRIEQLTFHVENKRAAHNGGPVML